MDERLPSHAVQMVAIMVLIAMLLAAPFVGGNLIIPEAPDSGGGDQPAEIRPGNGSEYDPDNGGSDLAPAYGGSPDVDPANLSYAPCAPENSGYEKNLVDSFQVHFSHETNAMHATYSIRTATQDGVQVRTHNGYDITAVSGGEQINDTAAMGGEDPYMNVTVEKKLNPAADARTHSATDWVLTRETPGVTASVASTTGNQQCASLYHEEYRDEATGVSQDVFLSDQVVYYGNISDVQRTTRVGEEFIGIQTEDGGLETITPLSRRLIQLSIASEYNFGSDNNKTVMIVATGLSSDGLSFWEPQHTAGTATFAVDKTVGVTTPQSTHLHEYMHTQQQFAPGERLWWFTEASATYYGTMIHYTGDDLEAKEVRESWNRSQPERALADMSQWNSPRVPSDKGARVLARLDGKIQTKTGGQHSLMTVYRWMNTQQSSSVSYAMFRSKVVTLTDEETGEWLDERVLQQTEVPQISTGELPDTVRSYQQGLGPLAPTDESGD